MSNWTMDRINDQIMDMGKDEIIQELATRLWAKIKLMFLSEHQLRVLMQNELMRNDYYDREGF
tara:strand:+ start:361 stop:549 length:189 start_codon:yes stop_codon:yes gene_type:complete